MLFENFDMNMASELPDYERYNYLVKESARREEVWGLWEGGRWATYTDKDGREVAPVWPRAELAVRFCPEELKDCEPRKMTLDYWMNNWLTLVQNMNSLVSVFPDGTGRGKVVNPMHIFMDVQAEIAAYSY